MARKMMEYIGQQPAVWEKILNEREKLLEGFQNAVPEAAGKILLTGSGSSYIAAQAAASVYAEAFGLEAYAAYPAEAKRYLEFARPRELLVIAVSQSGKSNSTRRLMKDVREKGYFVVSLSANEEEAADGAADYHQLTACGGETVGPKTKGMTATVLTLYLMGMSLILRRAPEGSQAKACGELLESLYRSVEAFGGNLDRAGAFAGKHEAFLAGQRHFILIGAQSAYAAASEGALKLLETLYVPAFAYELEEYTHGIQNTMGQGICNLLLPTEAETLPAMEKLDRYGREHGCGHLVVTTMPWSDGEDVLKLTGSGSPYTAVFDVLPAIQVMSARGSQYKGIECDRPKFGDFYAVMDTKAR